MPLTYYKRYRMEFDFRRQPVSAPVLPDGYRWVPWHGSLRDAHANVKFSSFRNEIDAQVFVCLSDLPGCRRLMDDIAGHDGFVSGATWMIGFEGNVFHGPLMCGTIQGLRHTKWVGAIQNVGVLPEHRGFGLGRALVMRSLLGFQSAGVRRVYLEVTAANERAVQLYRELGFQLARTRYREVETASAPALV